MSDPLESTKTEMPVLQLPDDRDEAHHILEAALRAAPGVWHEVWYPSTSEANYDVLRYVASEDFIDSHKKFADCGPIYLSMIGARS